MRIFAAISLAGLAVFSGGAFAESEDLRSLGHGERQQRKDQAHAMHAQAKAMRHEADENFKAEYAACWKKFFVQHCMDNSKEAKKERIAASRKIDEDAWAIERELRSIEGAEREARWEENLPQRDAENAARAERNRQSQQHVQERVERKNAAAEERLK